MKKENLNTLNPFDLYNYLKEHNNLEREDFKLLEDNPAVITTSQWFFTLINQEYKVYIDTRDLDSLTDDEYIYEDDPNELEVTIYVKY